MKGKPQKNVQPTAVAVTAVRKCADAMESQAHKLAQALPGLPMDASLRTKALELCARLKDTSGRVMFELTLLEAEVSEGKTDAGTVLRSLSGLDAAMLGVMVDATEVVDQLEYAAERDEAQEPAFVLVIEAVGLLMQAIERAKAATGALLGDAGR